MKEMIKKLKTKWKIENNKDFILIMLVFSLAGLGVSVSRRGIFHFFGIDHTALAVRIFFWLLLIVPLYQLSTLVFALPLGQFTFFWQRQKALAKHLTKLFKK